MFKSCDTNAGKVGVYVETWSGEVRKVICDVRGPWKIRHFVRVENLRLYPAKVKCKGRILSDRRLIEFAPSDPAHTVTFWTATIKSLPGCLDQTLDPCGLRPTSSATGTEIINTEVSIEWYKPGKKQTLTLDIKVNA